MAEASVDLVEAYGGLAKAYAGMGNASEGLAEVSEELAEANEGLSEALGGLAAQNLEQVRIPDHTMRLLGTGRLKPGISTIEKMALRT